MVEEERNLRVYDGESVPKDDAKGGLILLGLFGTEGRCAKCRQSVRRPVLSHRSCRK